MTREEKKEYNRKYYLLHRDAIKEQSKHWKETHTEERKKYTKDYYTKNRDKCLDYVKNTKMGRALNLLTTYRHEDNKHNRSTCTLTAKWIVENIFNKRCLYCGEEDWRLLGADRIDNNKAHTPNNIVCSCSKCNTKRNTKEFLEFAYSIGAKDSEGLFVNY